MTRCGDLPISQWHAQIVKAIEALKPRISSVNFAPKVERARASTDSKLLRRSSIMKAKSTANKSRSNSTVGGKSRSGSTANPLERTSIATRLRAMSLKKKEKRNSCSELLVQGRRLSIGEPDGDDEDVQGPT